MSLTPLLWPSVETSIEEIPEVKALNALLTGLEYSVQAWEAALLLYRTAINPPTTISRRVASRWRWIACNECILELYHLRSRLEKIQSIQLGRCPSLRQWVDKSAIRNARKKLDEYFPDIEALRHATAHRGENEVHSEAHAPSGSYALSGFREPHIYSTPYRGKLYSLSITDESLNRIVEVVKIYLGAFKVAAIELEKQGHLE